MVASTAPIAGTAGGAAAVTAAQDLKARGLCLEEYLEAMEEGTA